MVLKLRSGALTASLTPIEERVIGPSLGEDSIIKGITAAVTGLLLIMIFMVIYYRAAGVNSVIALLLNILLLMGAVAYFGFTLTLPGIAGIILTIGMAVDANVLIFERIKEEMQEGKSSKSAIDTGFKKAFVSILDANLTTVIAAFFLMQFGTGPIKGFAVTLIIGICASMFTALFVSRVIFDLVYVKARKKQFKLSPLKIGNNLFFKKQSSISFMNKHLQWTAYVLSSLILLAGIITYFSRGFNLGIDFTGGQMIEVSFTEKVALPSSTNVNKAEVLRTRLQRIGLSQAIIQQVDTTGNRFFIKFQKLKNTQSQITNHKQDSIPQLHISDIEAENTSLDKSNNKKFLRMRHGVKGGAVFSKSAPLDPPEEIRILSTHTVGPQVGATMKHKVFLAVFLALLGMLIYIGIRFKWVYGVAAVFTLVHDILICLTILLIFNIEITLPVAAALLTIMGYSLNDTIVIFDRIRDNIKHMVFKKPGGKEVILNQSINQMLGRTIVTSGTTLAAVLAIFFFGGEVLHDFSFTLIIGIIVGTYSSIFQSCAWLRFIPGSIGSR
jgi:SecD/SecF fusion protein